MLLQTEKKQMEVHRPEGWAVSSEQNLERIRGAGTWVCRLCLDIFNFSILFYWPNGGSSSTWGMSRTLRGVKEQQALEYAGRALEMMGRGRGGDTSLSLSLWPVSIVDALKQLFSAQQHFCVLMWPLLLMHSNRSSPCSSILLCSVDALCEQTMLTGQRRSVITITEKASLVPAH